MLTPPVPGITRVASLKIFGVTVSNHLTFSKHIQHTISSCAQTLYTMKILRAHGMIDTVLQQVYKSVTLSKFQYASCAWWSFTKASDRQRIDNFIRRSVKSGFYPPSVRNPLEVSVRRLRKNCLIRFCTIHYMFCISSSTSVYSKPELQPHIT